MGPLAIAVFLIVVFVENNNIEKHIEESNKQQEESEQIKRE